MKSKEIKSSPSQEFLERKETIRIRKGFEEFKHKLRMKELEFLRESDRIHHERELERGRIKSAEIRKTLIQKQMGERY